MLRFALLMILIQIHPSWGVELLGENEDFISSIEIEAGELIWNRSANEYEGKGGVVIRSNAVHLKAEQILINVKEQKVIAKKGVVLTDSAQQISLHSDSVELDLQKKVGVILNGSLSAQHKGITYLFYGERIEKQGDDTYRVVQGSFTTCLCPPEEKESWKITGQEIQVTLGGYATARNGAFWVRGIPILYLPYMIFPVKTERESGFLFPEFSVSGRKGFEAKLPYYWAFSDTKDLTITPHYASQWGGGGGVEYRYRLTQEGYGQWQSEFFDQGLREDSEEGDALRWRAKAQHNQYLDHGLGIKLDGDVPGDNDYFNDFETGKSDRLRPFTTSSLHLYKADEKYLASLYGSYYDNLKEVDSGQTVQKAPAFEIATRRFQFLEAPLYWNGTMSMANFFRTGEAFDDLGLDGIEATGDVGEGSGSFEEGEPVREGARFVVKNTLSAPLQILDRWTWTPEASFSETAYRLTIGENPFKERHLFTLKSAQGTIFYRVFSISDQRKILHAFEPNSYYLYAPQVDQDDLPLLDSYDRIEEKSLMVYSLTQRLLAKVGGEISEILYFKLAQHYNFLDEEQPLSDILWNLEMTPTAPLKFSAQGNYDLYGTGLRTLESAVEWNSLRADRLKVGYFRSDRFTVSNRTRVEVSEAFDVTYEREETERLFGAFEVPVTSFLALGTELDYSLLKDRLEESRYEAIYTSLRRCWRVTAGFHKTLVPEEQKFEVLFTLIGVGDIGR